MTVMGGTIGAPTTIGRLAPGRTSTAQRVQSRSVNLLAALLALVGVILPTEVQVSIAGERLGSGRIAIFLLLFPALFKLCQKSRRLLLCDFLVFATVGWVVVATVHTSGVGALSAAAGGEALDLLGGYVIARAYFCEPAALNTFIRVLKMYLIIAIILAMADSISGRFIVHDTIAAIVNASNWPIALYRGNMVRAASTFDHPILFGLFCAFTAAILIYWEQSLLRRSLFVSICFLGCILSLSSAAFISFSLIVMVYTYDQLMRRYSWRWRFFWIVLVALIFALFIGANHPIGWAIRHFTLDSQTGWYRMVIWDTALAYIDRAPVTGYGYGLFGNIILDNTIDSMWLVYSLRCGIPMIILFFSANVAAFLPTKQERKKGTNEFCMDRKRRAFTLVLLMFMFAALTVHFWNFMWMFWGLCIGIRASFRELSSDNSRAMLAPAIRGG